LAIEHRRHAFHGARQRRFAVAGMAKDQAGRAPGATKAAVVLRRAVVDPTRSGVARRRLAEPNSPPVAGSLRYPPFAVRAALQEVRGLV
jgi:hypothetical protein